MSACSVVVILAVMNMFAGQWPREPGLLSFTAMRQGGALQ
jgi:hypothetical protein